MAFHAGKKNGESCNKDAECRSGDCHKGDGPYKNKCKDPSHPSHYPSHKFPNGAKCEKDSQCASGDCHKGDGPFKNICKDHKSNGQSCSKDADCASGDCHKGAGDYQNKCKAPSRPAAFYAAPANFAAHTSDKLQFKLDGSEGRNGKCLGVEDHHDVSDGTKLIMWDCVDDAVGQEFTFDGDRLMYDGKCATWSNTGVTLESCSSDENQDIQVMFNKQYTHNIKFTGFGDYCLTGHSGSDAKDRVVYGESCDHEKQHWKIIQL